MPRRFLNLNIGDYLRDTQGLDCTVSGGYLHLLMHYTAHGKLPTDDKSLRTIARMTGYQWKIYKPVLQRFFSSDWRQGRVEADLMKQERLSTVRAIAGQTGGRNRKVRAKYL